MKKANTVDKLTCKRQKGLIMKTNIDKRDCEMSYKIKTIDKKFADITEGSKMFTISKLIIDEYVKRIFWKINSINYNA